MSAPDIRSDRNTVWINSGVTGACIGRFGRMGIDIHKEILPEQELNGTECLSCTHGPATLADWIRFVNEMKQFYDIDVGEEHRPTWLED